MTLRHDILLCVVLFAITANVDADGKLMSVSFERVSSSLPAAENLQGYVLSDCTDGHHYVRVDGAFSHSFECGPRVGFHLSSLGEGVHEVCVSLHVDGGAPVSESGYLVMVHQDGGVTHSTHDKACDLHAGHVAERVLVTGCAGFIGSHLTEHLLARGDFVACVDNMDTTLYNLEAKHRNIQPFRQHVNFTFYEEDFSSSNAIHEFKPDVIVALAALAGVRNSLLEPLRYMLVNVVGFTNILEGILTAKRADPAGKGPRLVYASSSSVYGLNKKQPFTETDAIELPNSPYAASKKSGEAIAGMYSRLHKISAIGLRFFTVYGPRGRPDMAPYMFLKKVHDGDVIPMLGRPDDTRDYTFVSDIVSGILGAMGRPAEADGHHSTYNLGNASPVKLSTFIEEIGKAVGVEPKMHLAPARAQGDVPHTYANVTKAQAELGYMPKVPINIGLAKTYLWMKRHVLGPRSDQKDEL